MKWLLLFLAALPLAAETAAPSTAGAITDVPIHDPVMYRQDGVYYLFATGPGVAVWSSPDRVHWTREKPVFAAPPTWAVEAVPTFRGNIWAPDISFYSGRYYLFYAVSAFGKNTSCIGVATNETLDPRSPRFRWVDHGVVIQSIPGVTNWNAIDPNIIADADGTAYMAFGSFWEGIKLVRLTPDRLGVAEPLDHLPTIASRKADPQAPNPPAPAGNPVDAGGNAIEAPFIFKHANRYYLFASIDYCCRGAKSNYKMIIGRADAIAGPYLDKSGKPLARGGGTLLLAGDKKWYGVGHNGANTFDGVDYIVFHGYDASDPYGRSKLRIERLIWDADGWPKVDVASRRR
ncbi:MAG TPA: family 43 glycosylhydrolase [Opitutaceae bacterium]